MNIYIILQMEMEKNYQFYIRKSITNLYKLILLRVPISHYNEKCELLSDRYGVRVFFFFFARCTFRTNHILIR